MLEKRFSRRAVAFSRVFPPVITSSLVSEPGGLTPQFCDGVVLAEIGVGPALQRDDVEGGQAVCARTTVIPTVMAEPCFAWKVGTHASFSKRSGAEERFDRNRRSSSSAPPAAGALAKEVPT